MFMNILAKIIETIAERTNGDIESENLERQICAVSPITRETLIDDWLHSFIHTSDAGRYYVWETPQEWEEENENID